jgi:zinc protease
MLDRTIAPAFHKNSSLEILNAQITELPNGIKVYSISGGQQEVIKIELIFRAGRWFEPKTGAAHFAATLISKGTDQKSSFEIARIFDLYGAHLEINPGLDVVSVALFSLNKNIRPVLDLLLDIISHAAFPEKEIDQSKAIFLQNLQVNNEKTSFQASKLFRKNVFGESHPYGKELEENIKELTREDLCGYFANYFKDLFVIVSGKISPQSIALINDSFSKIDFRLNVLVSHPIPGNKPSRVLTEKEGSLQSSIRMGKRFIGRNHPDYFDVLLLNHILGGYFGSRLMKNIREDKGFTYGIYSSLHTLTFDNYLVIGADVNKENLEATFDEIKKELKRLRTEKIGTDELDTARNHFIGSLQSEITTPFSHADKWKNILLYGLSRDYYSRLVRRIESLTPEDLVTTAEQYYAETTFFEIAVG